MSHQLFMQRALSLAACGTGRVAPNPLVGAVVVYGENIIGEGFHQVFGGPHAEVHAIRCVQDSSLLSQSTLYVTLEPCCHYGKTPPCTDLISQSGIKKVVVACRDPFPAVSGKGIETLRSNGIEVLEGVCEQEARHLNRRFMTFHEKRRPYVILKWAETSDGFIARSDYSSRWISSQASRTMVHHWRAEEAAILIGTTTCSVDNPKLTVRIAAGEYRNPVRVTLDRTLKLEAHLHLLTDGGQTLIFTGMRNAPQRGTAEWIYIDFSGDVLSQILDVLFQRKLLSVLVEGGSTTLQHFLSSGIWDEARVFRSSKTFGEGIRAPVIQGEAYRTETIDGDTLSMYRRTAL